MILSEVYLKEVWPAITQKLKDVGIKAELNLVSLGGILLGGIIEKIGACGRRVRAGFGLCLGDFGAVFR